MPRFKHNAEPISKGVVVDITDDIANKTVVVIGSDEDEKEDSKDE